MFTSSYYNEIGTEIQSENSKILIVVLSTIVVSCATMVRIPVLTSNNGLYSGIVEQQWFAFRCCLKMLLFTPYVITDCQEKERSVNAALLRYRMINVQYIL